MSASWNKRIYNPPPLPVELWLRIIETATSIPGILEPEMYKISDLPNAETIRLQQLELRASLVTKRNLVRLSKAWYAMAAPYLYETIIIGRQRTLISLCITLMHSENKGENPSSGSHPLGWYTKRLDFAARDSGDMFLNSLAEAIRYLPNLTMFNFNPHGYVSSSLYSTFSSVARALADTCGLNLRQLNFSRHCLQESDWQVLLSSTPNLLAFHSTDTLAGIPLLRGSAAAQLTNLRSLIVLPEHGHMRPWKHTHSFSDLRHLELASCEAANQLSVKTTPIPVRALFLHIRRRYDYP
ncbi:hypothetical protein HWV62_10641 [Athelia sp. TMB]|nr:hypothetical protein HWV62_10641 [Athelia sp. TMB]